MALMSAISPLNGGNLNDYYVDRAYPIDMNGAQDYMRPATGVSPFPYPLLLSYVSGFLPMQDANVYAAMIGKTPYGPYVGQAPRNMSAVFPSINGGMVKTGG